MLLHNYKRSSRGSKVGLHPLDAGLRDRGGRRRAASGTLRTPVGGLRPVRISAVLGLIAGGLIALGCLAAALAPRSAALPPSAPPKAAPSPTTKSWPADNSQYGGATPIARERWINGIEFSERHYAPQLVLVAFDITASGAAKHCKVTAPIPQDGFGQKVCAAMERNARFLPKRGAHGKAIATRGWVKVRFVYDE